jgi:hypothetical protein
MRRHQDHEEGRALDRGTNLIAKGENLIQPVLVARALVEEGRDLAELRHGAKLSLQLAHERLRPSLQVGPAGLIKVAMGVADKKVV